jgi:hypothetical protein
MQRKISSSNSRKPAVIAKLDRLAIRAFAETGSCVKRIDGFRVISDVRPQTQGKLRTYGRLRRFESLKNSATISEQYQPQLRWLSDCRFLMIAEDKTGITPHEIKALLKQTLGHRVSMFELALDFSPSLGIDEQFVRRHALFGKSRRRKQEFAGFLHFGSRASTKLVRCYRKESVSAYRVEIQANSGLLHRHKIKDTEDLPRLASLLYPTHFRFVGLALKPLRRHLIWKFGLDGMLVYNEAKRRSNTSLRGALRYLASVHVSNPSRFLAPLPINQEVQRAIKRWVKTFSRQEKKAVAAQKGNRVG